MSWLLIRTFLKKAWIWLKTHWQIPFLVIWTMVVWVLTRRNSQAIVDVLNAKKKSYEDQLQLLRDNHRDELLERDNLVEQYREAIEKIETDFREKEKELTEKQKEMVKKIVRDSKGDPGAVWKEIEALFDLTYSK